MADHDCLGRCPTCGHRVPEDAYELPNGVITLCGYVGAGIGLITITLVGFFAGIGVGLLSYFAVAFLVDFWNRRRVDRKLAAMRRAEPKVTVTIDGTLR